MPIKLNRLITVGFLKAGEWRLSGRGLELDLDEIIAGKRDVLYAFTVSGALAYIGKTASTLRARMQGYKTQPSHSQNGGSTNIKNNRNIVEALSQHNSVEVYVLFDQAQQKHGEFVFNMAAGLEDSLIRELAPPWNGNIASRNERASVMDRPASATKPLHIRNEPRLSKTDFRVMLQLVISEAMKAGEKSVDVRAGNLHTRVGGYPARGHSMPTCCSAMRDEMKAGDEVLAEPPKGKGASLLIRYHLLALEA